MIFRDRALHVASWAKRFLFRPEQLDTSVSKLSGGEKPRIVLARLMLQPADLLVIDEPTDDLDIPTLDVLEESVQDFAGALVLVTHDRLLLDRISTQVLALDGRGGAGYFADLEQALAWSQGSRDEPASGPQQERASKPKRRSETVGGASSRGRSGDRQRCGRAAQRFDELTNAQNEVEQLYRRWSELEGKAR